MEIRVLRDCWLIKLFKRMMDYVFLVKLLVVVWLFGKVGFGILKIRLVFGEFDFGFRRMINDFRSVYIL